MSREHFLRSLLKGVEADKKGRKRNNLRSCKKHKRIFKSWSDLAVDKTINRNSVVFKRCVSLTTV